MNLFPGKSDKSDIVFQMCLQTLFLRIRYLVSFYHTKNHIS